MNAITNTLEIISRYPVIPVYYHEDKETCIDIVKACYSGGIRVFEFTNRGQNARENFKALLEYRDNHLPDLQLGIGTIKTVEQAQDYIDLGANFIVSPIVKEDIAKLAFSNAILWIPGCMTPTEISFAEVLGASLIKLFPGDTLKPGFLKAIKPLFPGLKFMPTGGVDVNKENIDSWLDAGVTALGFGSKLFQAPQEATDYSWLSKQCHFLLDLINKGS